MPAARDVAVLMQSFERDVIVSTPRRAALVLKDIGSTIKGALSRLEILILRKHDQIPNRDVRRSREHEEQCFRHVFRAQSGM